MNDSKSADQDKARLAERSSEHTIGELEHDYRGRLECRTDSTHQSWEHWGHTWQDKHKDDTGMGGRTTRYDQECGVELNLTQYYGYITTGEECPDGGGRRWSCTGKRKGTMSRHLSTPGYDEAGKDQGNWVG